MHHQSILISYKKPPACYVEGVNIMVAAVVVVNPEDVAVPVFSAWNACDKYDDGRGA